MKREYGADTKAFVNRGNWGFPHEKKYVVSAKWWRKWGDYVSFESMSEEKKLLE